MTTPREIIYSRETKDYAASLNQVLIGFYRSYSEAEQAIDTARLAQLQAANGAADPDTRPADHNTRPH